MAANIFEHLGDVPNHRLFRNQVLVAIGVRSTEKVLAGGHKLYLPEKTADEDRYQAKPGLIIKLGRTAFVDQTGEWFDGDAPRVGEWVFYRASDGWSLDLYGNDRKTRIACRILNDTDLKGVTTDPGSIW